MPEITVFEETVTCVKDKPYKNLNELMENYLGLVDSALSIAEEKGLGWEEGYSPKWVVSDNEHRNRFIPTSTIRRMITGGQMKHTMRIGSYLSDMKSIKEMCTDIEEAHRLADDILCALLVRLGHDEIVTVFKSIKKWYA